MSARSAGQAAKSSKSARAPGRTDDPAAAQPTAGEQEPRWGLGDVALGFFAAELASIVVGAVALAVSGYSFGAPTGSGAAFGQVAGHLAVGRQPTTVEGAPLWFTYLLQLPLWLFLIGVPIWATRRKGRGIVHDLGLRFRLIDVPIGLVAGLAGQLLLVPAIYFPLFKLIGQHDVSAAARQLTDKVQNPADVVVIFLLVAIGAPVAEEIFFRGLTQRSLLKKSDLSRFNPWGAILVTAAFFAASHFELLQLPALFAFGVVLGVLAWRTERLGPSIVAHLTFNAIAAATLVWNLSLPG